MIELKNITKVFYKKNNAIRALSDISLHVPEGKIFGVIGASGAGKSTLIRCVNLLEQPTSGQVIVDGENLTDLLPAQLTQARRNIGMIFQHFNLLSSRTVFENVAFTLELSNTPKEEIKKRVTDLLSLVGLDDKLNEYPANLSGGQKQRVAIARTLASNPKVLLCDEATSALDPATTQSILALLKDINQRFNMTILLITHEMNVVKSICDEVAVISEGKLIEQGTVGEIFSHPKTDLTRQFIASSIHFAIPAEYQKRLSASSDGSNRPLLKLEFTGESTSLPALSEVTRLFDVSNNIVSAQMDYVGGIRFGVMLIELSGSEQNIKKATDYYIMHHIKAEVLGYV
ncbi:methionine ABC transporter ATP-binding protein MetN [Arcticibacter eurypsychrophilus]|uniref:methionine ABC transporter ATP-binding protein MetN n=1 Tax=Arcticibacter eurypsychrophilus TaxID=1434752 RepID=UPI00084CEDC8|nr:methionine ABC transporter ATP-binding protein MetN [Arcticibacter eurypsychrophilus]